MAEKKASPIAGILPRLWATDMTLLIGMAGIIMPRLFDSLAASLDEKQRRAIDKVLPAKGGKRMYVQLLGSPTPPIVVELAQPLRMSTKSEKEVREQGIRGIRLTCDDALLAAGGLTAGAMLKLLWRLKGQLFTMLRISWTFLPLLRLGRSEMKDMQDKLNAKTAPLLGLLGV
ncbi:MAG TPA: hypothetical protein VEB87_00995 [Nitrososphaerales archaeon]|nr:hypothetical protein [Nitrososphaerales archaeon]